MRIKIEQNADVRIERARPEDLDTIMRIEQASFTMPWTRKMFEVELSQNPFGRLEVLRRTDAALIGYVCYWVVFEECRLMTLAVEPSLRRQGLGRALLRHAMGRGREAGATRGLLEVRASNGTAIQLYEQEGFRRVAVRARYYTSPVEDAVLMERALDHS
jgi:ribosomal-protein-alanine N-acetyltransferase